MIILIKIEGEGTEVRAVVGSLKLKERYLFLDAKAFKRVELFLMPSERHEYAALRDRNIDSLTASDRLISTLIGGFVSVLEAQEDPPVPVSKKGLFRWFYHD